MSTDRLRNWAGNHAYPASVVHRPATVAQLRHVVAASPRLRGLGSRRCCNFTWKPLQPEVEALLPRLEAALAPFAARPHWGKLFADVDRTLARRYPRMDDSHALVAGCDPEGKFGNDSLDRHVPHPHQCETALGA